ncbi:mannosyl-oligosaccharide alpha-1,2-mannosidase [Fusarium longipes]|uniref:alpha-1,2-Mannosidase n=1 Tax=Fusarium longipes TaxID=694270 RepID=A0A395T0A1_9HYPO|nr:mannosyl-oligosaccharide alpha-1,2-mannosidase [Fusarium longipes]
MSSDYHFFHLLPPKNSISEDYIRYLKQRGRDYDYTDFESVQIKRADEIVEMFRFALDGYFTHAFHHDSLRPKYNNYTDNRNGWGVTAVDGLDTAILMEQIDIVETILDFIPTIDFTKTNAPRPSLVSNFETNIRYLGGLLGAYGLLKGLFRHLKIESNKIDVLLVQAKTLADTLKFGFEIPSGIPVNDIFIENKPFNEGILTEGGGRTTGLAVMGSLILKWQHSSDPTGDPQYGELANRAEDGTFGIETGEILDNFRGWTSGNDSAYEYLTKISVYDPDRFSHYGKRFAKAADSTIKHLISHLSSRPDSTMVLLSLEPAMNRSDWLDYGLTFSEYCANGHRYAAYGIGPTLYSWDTEMLSLPENSNETERYSRASSLIPDNCYGDGQAPEAVESWYYSHQHTKSQYWRDVAWAFTLAQNRTMRVGGGFASVHDVLSPSGNGTCGGITASFMLAETLTYQWLIQTGSKGQWDVLGGEGGD